MNHLKVFTLVPAVKDSLFRDAPPAATLLKVSEMNILTVDNSHKMLTSIDGALKRVDAERGDLGATMNRMGHTIDNLGNISVNLSASRSRIEMPTWHLKQLSWQKHKFYSKQRLPW